MLTGGCPVSGGKELFVLIYTTTYLALSTCPYASVSSATTSTLEYSSTTKITTASAAAAAAVAVAASAGTAAAF